MRSEGLFSGLNQQVWLAGAAVRAFSRQPVAAFVFALEPQSK